MAEKYGKLPTEILSQANTIDLFIFDTVEGYKHERERIANGEKPKVDMNAIQKKYKEYKNVEGNNNNRSK